MRIRIYLYIGVAFIALAGCASTPTAPTHNVRYSDARNITRAAGMDDVRDVPWERYQRVRDEARAQGKQIDERSLVGPSISALSVYFGNVRPFDLSPGRAAALDLFMTLNRPDSASVSSQLLAWMPRELAASAVDAQWKMTDILATAIKRAAGDVAWPSGLQVNDIQVRTDRQKRLILVHISGGDCDQQTIRCMYAFFLGGQLPQEVNSPEILGGGASYAFTASTTSDSSTWSIEGRTYRELSSPKGERPAYDKIKSYSPRLIDFEFYTAISRHLPKWAYLYLTPARDSVAMPVEDGKRAFLRIPVLLHEGKVMLFVEPEPRKTAATQ